MPRRLLSARARWVVLGIVVLAAAAAPYLAVPQPIERSMAPRKEMVLTFNCAWDDQYGEQLIDILRRHRVRATFFVTGKWLQQCPDLGRRLVQAGQEVNGNHSFAHPRMTRMSAGAIRADMERADRLMRQVLGVKPLYFRPPYEEYNDRVLRVAASMGYKTVQCSIDTRDWANPGVDKIVSSVLDHAAPGAIVMLHQGRQQPVEALPRIIEGLQARGYRLVTLSEALRPPQVAPSESAAGRLRDLGRRVERRLRRAVNH